MTNMCSGGGLGVPNPQQAAVVDYSAGLLAAIFAAYDIAWLIPVIPLVGLAPLGLNTFCDSTIPAIPTFTSAETNAILQLQIGTANWTSGMSKVSDLVKNVLWSYACHCQTGTAAAYTPPTMPTGTPVATYQPPLNATPCHSFTQIGTLTAGPTFVGNTTCNGFFTLTFETATGGVISTVNLPSQHEVQNTQTYAIPAGTAHGFMLYSSTTCGFTNFNDGGYDLTGLNASGIELTSVEHFDSGTNTTYEQYNLNVLCNAPGQPTQVVPNCCPPDLATQAQLDAILKLVTLIQRQNVPFAYVHGSTFTRLSGTGEIPVQGLIGCQVIPTTIPSRVGQVVGDPTEYWLDTWVNWGNADGWTAREFVRTNPFLSLPPLAGQFTKIGYSVAAGVEIALITLLREP